MERILYGVGKFTQLTLGEQEFSMSTEHKILGTESMFAEHQYIGKSRVVLSILYTLPTCMVVLW